jgi:hypothetical protein
MAYSIDYKKRAVEYKDAGHTLLAQQFGCTPQAVFYMLLKLKITVKKRPLPIQKNRKINAPG